MTTQCEDSASLLTLLRDLSQSSPDAHFLCETSYSSLTYRQTYLLVTSLIPLRLRTTITQNRSRKVILISSNTVLVPLIMWSFWFLSITVVPISTKIDPTLLNSMVELIDPDAILYAKPFEKLVSGVRKTRGIARMEIEEMIPDEYREQQSPSRVSDFIPSLSRWISETRATPIQYLPSQSADQGALCLFTSSAVDASTLKCVTYTHTMLLESGKRMMDTTGDLLHQQPLRHLGFLPLSHCFELCFSLLTLVLRSGGTYIIFDKAVSSPDLPMSAPLSTQLMQSIRYHQPVHSICLVPAIFEAISKDITQNDLSLLKIMKLICVGGAPSPESLLNWAAEHELAYNDACGATELTGLLGLRSVQNKEMRENGLQIVCGMEGFIEKEKEEDMYGELIIRGKHLSRGYDNKDSPSFHYEPSTGITTYRTGDLYGFTPSINLPWSSFVVGQELPTAPNSVPSSLKGLKYNGRVDDLAILASGLKVDALSLERTLDTHSRVLRSAVIPVSDRRTLAVLLQIADTAKTERLDQKELLDFVLGLNRHLTLEKRIHAENIFLVDQLPITTKHTLNRKLVRKIWMDNSGQWPEARRITDVPPSARPVTERIRERVASLMAKIFSIPAEYFFAMDASLSDIPLASLDAVRLARALEEEFSVRVTEAQLYGLRNVGDVHALVGKSETKTVPSSSSSLSGASSRILSLPTSPGIDDDSLVISGSACRFPGHIHSLSDLTSALLDPSSYAKTVKKDVPSTRWKSDSIPEEAIPPIAWLEDKVFENLVSFRNFFNISPADAESLSPNARLVLQLGYQAIEDAGLSPRSLDGRNWGVFTSVNSSGWRERRVSELSLHQYAMSIVGSADDAVGARLSYFLNLTGPAVEIKTACSSSAVAIHQACSAIRNGDCEAAIVIASTTHFHPSGAIFRVNAGIASKSGRCATFSDNADGFLPSEGAAAIVIQRASDVQSKPYAKIRGSHVAQDGRARGFFSPNPLAQERLVTRALERASISANDIDYYETHGTGTRIGDAIELQTIQKVFAGKRTNPLPIGSVKAALGHTEECAGLASVLKSIICLKENFIPPQPNIERLNQQIDFIGNRMIVHQRLVPFVRKNKPRHIGISSFGLSGTLAHIILEDLLDNFAASDQKGASFLKIFLLSAANQTSFQSLLRRVANYTVSPAAFEDEFSSICRTSQLGRDHHTVRRAWYAEDLSTLSKFLFDELEKPNPHHTRKPAKIGLWFGLPTTATMHTPDCPLFHELGSEYMSIPHDSPVKFLAEQLMISNMLRRIGCDISVVGGEGLAELGAAVFANILSSSAVFSGCTTDGCMRSLFVVRGAKEDIREALTQWPPSRLALRGSISFDISLLEGDSIAVHDLVTLGGFELLEEIALPSCEPSISTTSAASMTYVSSILGDVLEEDILTRASYWSNISTSTNYTIDGPGAFSALASHCDIIVTLGGRPNWYPDVVRADAHAADTPIIHMGGESDCIEKALAQLYERGATINWLEFGVDGQRSHLPTYEIV